MNVIRTRSVFPITRWYILCILCFTVFELQAQVTLYSENFTYDDGQMQGAGNPPSWTLNNNGFSPAVFSVQSSRVQFTNTGGEVVWQSRVFPINDWLFVNASVELPATANMEASDYLRVYYKINGGAEVLFPTNGNNPGNYSTRIASVSNLSGNTMQIIVRVSNNDVNESHYLDNIQVTGSSDLYYEPFNYPNGTVASSLWTITGSATTFSVQNNEFQYRNSPSEVVWASSVVNISGYSSISLFVTLRENSTNTLESTDYIGVYYKINGGAEVLFADNGYFADDFPAPYTFTASQTGLSGNTVQIIIRMRTNANDEYYYWDDVRVMADFPPAALSLSSSGTNIPCAGDSSGAVDLTVTGGRAPYSFSWSNGATTEDLSGIPAGNYTVTVTDYSGATATIPQTITEPPAMSLFITKTDASRYGSADGAADLTVTGSNLPNAYLWSNGSTAEDITGVLPGVYIVTVTDAIGCKATAFVQIGYNTPYDTIRSGSFIVNLGVTPQTFANGLKPYGMVYDLVKNYKVPVRWSIRPGKVKDGIDFTYNGVNYRGSAFIIDEEWITPAVASRIAYWQAQGVVGTYTTSDFAAPIFHTFSGFTNVVIDDQNDGLVIPYFTNAGIPSSFYSVGLPPDLNDCSDTYVLPHADPTWAEHKYLLDFNMLNNGYIWAGCHAVSVLEGISDPLDVSKRMNFLSSNGLQCFGANKCGPLIPESHPKNPLLPFTYNPQFNDHPVMQFVGDMVPATTNGSEQWYIPLTTGRWNIGASPAVSTADGGPPRNGAKLVFGRGFDKTNNGMVMYEGGHEFDSGSMENQVAAQRAFFNFLFLASIDKGLVISHNVPKTFVKGIPQTVAATASKGTPPYSYQWTATCGGTFSNPASAITDFTVSELYTDSKCYLIVEVTDACGRYNFVKVRIGVIQSNGVKSNYNGVNVSCYGASDGSIDLTTTGGTAPYTWQWNTGATTEDISGLSAGTYIVTITDADGYVDVDTFVLTQPNSIGIGGSITHVSCFGGNNGAVSTSVSGGIAPYTYAWSTGATTANISGRIAGTYTVTVTDLNGCTASSPFTITQPAQLTASLDVTNVSTCFGSSDGSINLTASGGTAPYTYNWADIPGTNDPEDRSVLSAGTYSVTVTDSKGCTASANATVTQPPPLGGSTTQVNVACNGAATGSIDLTPTGGTPPYSYAWTNGATTQDISGLIAGSYTVTVTDARGCTITRSATITQPATLTTSETHVNVYCYGGNNGSIDLTVSGGVGPYAYLWNTGHTTQDRSSLPAGLYTVTVTDANSCTVSRSVEITQPPVLSTSLTQVNVSCYGGSDGSIDLTVSGGVAPYSYLWSGGITTEDRSGLTAGTYNVTITDANGCTASTGASITQPFTLTLSATHVNVSCYGGSNGSINLTVNGGTTPYSFLWSHGSTLEDITGLSAGSYAVTVTDANNCTATLSRTITQPALLSTSLTQVNVSCHGGNNGSIDLTVGGGTSPYTYLWSNGSAAQDISGLSAGTYTVTVTDALSCTTTSVTTITQPALFTASLTQVNVSCYNGNNGSIDLTVSGGTTPYAYSWSNGATTEDLSGLSAGSYTVTVSDANGCTFTTGATLTQPSALSASTTKINVSCYGGSNGSIDLTVSGGTTPYVFSWSNGATTEDLSGLSAGSYTVTVSDANGCTFTTGTTITEPTTLTASTSQVNVSCYGGSNGSIDLTVSGGTTPYAYSWSNGATTEDLSGLSAGSYTVTVSDANGCTFTTGATLTQPSALSASTTKINVSCYGGSNGSIDLTVSGGTTPYAFSWSNGATTEDLSGLSAGSYTVTVSDANGCTFTTGATLTQPSALSASTTKINVSCYGGSNGSIDLTVSGGTTPYAFSWSNGATTEDLSGLSAGSYTVTVSDTNGCTFTTGATITQPSALSASTTKINVSCYGGNNGSIDLTVSGGTTPYVFSWSNGATTEDLSGLSAGNYTVTVSDANGCSVTAGATITQPALLTASNLPVHVSCNGGNNGSVSLTVSGGTTPYTYLWSNGATTQNISSLTAGNYTVTVTDAMGCTITSGATISEPSQVNIIYAKQDVLCFGASSGSISLTVSGGTPPYAFSWSNGANTEDLSGLTAGNYTVTVTDANACTTSPGTITITQPASPVSLSWTTSDASCNGGSDGSIDLSVSGGTSVYTYAWSNGANTEDLTGLSAGNYTVTVTDAHNCIAQASIAVGEATPLVITLVSKTNVSCFGGSDGAIDISVSGGTLPLTYMWSNGSIFQDISGLTVGTYTVTVTDAFLCSRVATYEVTQPAVLNASASLMHVSCNGGNNGSINLIVAGGTLPYNFNWSEGSSSEDIFGLSAGTYTVTVTDANNCSITLSRTITEPAALTVSASLVHVNCNGGNDGEIDVSVGGGTPPFSYLWSTGATSQDLSSLSIGTYTVTVTDANNCSATLSRTITEPAVLSASALPAHVSCNGGSNGSIDLTVAGGTMPYVYSWSNGATSEDLTGLSVGNYTVTVTDANGCTALSGATITQPAVLSVNAVKTDVSCFGGNDGAVVLTVTGGTAPYSYNWSTGAITQNITGLVTGTYSVTVTDALGCTATASRTVAQPPLLISTITAANVSCYGGSDGSVIHLAVSGGTSPYTYLWSNGATTQNINGLSASTYRVTITDAKNCVRIDSVEITEPPLLSASRAWVNVSCYGGSDGSVDLSVTGGTMPYTYSWSNSATTEDISGLSVGTYTVTVTDDKGCTAVAIATITQPAALSVSSTEVAVSCFGGNNGSIDLTVSGGTIPYTYAWSNGAATQDISGLSAGTYTVSVNDAKGCSLTESFSITQPPLLSAIPGPIVHVSCNGFTDGSIGLTVTGGTMAYSYLWSNGATTQNISGLGVGSYSVTVTDAQSCTVSASVNITEPAILNASATQVNVSCNGGNDGLIDVNVTGGTIPYAYNWSNSANTQDVSGLTAGTYVVTIADAKGCTTTLSRTITEPATLTASTVQVNVSCHGGSNGSTDLTVSGGTTPYAYSWSNGATTEDLSGLSAGNYTVTVNDANGCTFTTGTTITEPTTLTASTSQVNVSCHGGSNGSIDLTVSGGTTPYAYSWSNGATTEDLSGLSAGNYTVTVNDANGCTFTTGTTITEPTTLTASTSQVNVSCHGGSNGSIDLTVSGGTTPYVFSWSNGATTEDLSGLSAGSYTVTVSDANGCTFTTGATLTQPSALSASTTKINVSCYGGSNGSIDLTVSGGTLPYAYSWSNGATTEDLIGVSAGVYTVTILDGLSCSITSSIPITEPDVLTATTTQSHVSCYGGMDGSMDLTVTGGTPPYIYSWSTGASTEDITALAVGTYSVTVSDNNGCTVSTAASITQPTALESSFAQVNVSCNGGNNGSIDLTITGGSPPYVFIWNTGATEEDISSLPAGTYTVTVTDAQSCMLTETVTIIEPALLVLSTAQTNVSCFSGSDGAIDLSVAGGSPPYTYLWSTGSTSQDVGGLSSGTYTVTVTDAQLCNATAAVTITQPPVLQVSETHTDVSCYGGNDGEVNLTVTGGTPPFSFVWSSGHNTKDVMNLTQGVYSVTVTDNKGCIVTLSAFIDQPDDLNTTVVVTDVSCHGGSDGTIDLTVNGGTPPYQFNWSNGDTLEDISGLSAGTFHVTVTDNHGCNTLATATVIEPTVLSATATKTNVSCNGGNDGAVDITATGGTPPYTYLWSNGDTTEDISGLSVGAYSATITDVKGCMTIVSATISHPASLTVSDIITHVSCNGGSDGAIDLTVQGGTPPYAYLWSNGETTEDLWDIAAADYTVTVTDAQGCFIVHGVTLSEPEMLTASAIKTDANCFGNSDGAVYLTVQGGTPPYTYIWSNGDTAKDLIGVPAGYYSVTVTDAQSCITVESATVSQPDELVLILSSTPATCGESNGEASVSVSGGIAPYSYMWSNGATTENIHNLDGGTYVITVTDAQMCQKTASVNLGSYPSVNFTVTIKNVTCHGGSDGSASVIISSGTPPFIYTWNPVSDTDSFVAGLPAGSYAVQVVDSLGCSGSQTVSVGQPSAYSINVAVTDVSCHGGSDGFIHLTVSGSTPPYTYNWSTGATSQDVSDLAIGSYQVTITDAQGCQTTAGANITQPSPLVTSMSAVQVSCHGRNDGQLHLAVHGGVAPYAFLWSTGDTIQNLSSLEAGNYSVTVSDANGCQLQDSTAIVEPDALSLSHVIQHASCNGSANGGIDISVTGGTVPYVYLWSTGDTTEDLSNLTAGSYDVMVSDSNGCTLSQSFIITQPSGLSVAISKTDVICFGESNGAISLTVSGGTAPYTFNWSNGATTTAVSGLAAGVYAVTVTDAQGCTLTRNVTILQPDNLTASLTQSNVRCNGYSDGAINLSVSGGTMPYSYNWSNGDTTQDLSGLSAGSYTVTVTDAQHCSATTSTTISQPDVLSAMVAKTDVRCNGGADGAIDLTVTGGVSNYTFNWSNGASTEDLSQISAGAYTVTVTDAYNCTTTATAVIYEPDLLSLSVAQTDVSCNGYADGAIDLTVTGGTGPYASIWSTGATTEDINGLTAGSYSVTIADAHNCSAAATITIAQPAQLMLTFAKTDVSCHGGNGGSVDMTVYGGTMPYAFVWSTGDTTEDISSLSAGTYVVTVTDMHNCVQSGSITVGQPAALSATWTVTNVQCYGGSDGAISLTVSGGTMPYAFLWSDSSVTEDLSGISAGTYSVTITDAHACSTTAVVPVHESDSLSITLAVTNTSCSGGKDGAIDATVTGGTPPYSYQWNTGATTEDITGLAAFYFSLTVTDSKGCSKSKGVSVGQPQPIQIALVSNTPVSCNGGTNGALDISVSGGTPGYTYQWSNGAASEDVSGLSAGTISVTVTDSKGCFRQASYAITQPSAISITLAGITPVSCNGGTNGALDISVSGGTPGYTYQWSNGATSEDIHGLGAGVYGVTVTDAQGCIEVASVNMPQPDALVVSPSVTHLTCSGMNNGAISLTVQGGTPAYSYLWSHGAQTRDVASLSAGSYTVTVLDAQGCSSVSTVVVNQPAPLTIGFAKTNVLCNSANNGAIDISVNGGVPPYQYVWSNGATTEDIAGIPAGSYSVTVSDANSCISQLTVTINQPAALTAFVIPQNVGCNGGASGYLNLAVSGGVAPYGFMWSTGDTSEDLSGLAAGSYSVIITDANGCVTSLAAVIEEPSPLAVHGSVVHASCSGSANGSINLSVSGGTPDYIYAWNTGETTKDLNTLSAGNYSVTVTDAHGCVQIQSFTVGAPTQLTVSVTGIADATCNGKPDGRISVRGNGGTAPYTYLWSRGDTSASLSNLAAGSYSVTITDANGCALTAHYNIGQPPVLSVNLTAISDALCHGSATGFVHITANGGTPGYSYLWSNGATTNHLDSLSEGSYSVTVTDMQNCTVAGNFNIGEPTDLAVIITEAKDASCYGGATGAINITVQGGTPPYTYLWSNGASSEDLSSLSAGTYTVTVTDVQNCAKTLSKIISQPDELNVTVDGVSDALCYGQASGSIHISVTGGTPPYVYLWSNGATSEDLVHVTAGSYSVTVTDAKFCTRTATYHIGQPAQALSIGVTGISDAKCNGEASGYIRINVSGGTPPYTYLWSNGATTQNGETLSAGSYQVTVTDAKGCTRIGNFNIGQPSALVVQAQNIQDVSCYGHSNGAITLNVAGGTAPYAYLWSNGLNTKDISNLPSGSYTVTISDANACVKTHTFLIDQPSEISITVSDSAHVSCYGGSNGLLDISVAGGTPPYVYLWNDGSTSEDLSALAAGTYTVTVTDAKNCNRQGTFPIMQPADLSIAVTAIQDASCQGAADGSIDITVQGGSPPYVYSWSHGHNTEDATGLLFGSYTVTVADSKGCLESVTYNIREPAAIRVVGIITDVNCFGDSSGAINITITGGTGVYSYTWSNGTSTRNLIAVAAGTYSVTVTDGNGCRGSETFHIGQPTQLDVEFTAVTEVSCYGGNNGSVAIQVSGGVPPYSYKWSNGMSDAIITSLAAGAYSVTVKDAHNCMDEDSVSVGQPTAIQIVQDTIIHTTCSNQQNGSVFISVHGGTPPYTYLWSNGSVAEDLQDVEAGNYTVTVTDAISCNAVGTFRINQPDAMSLSASIITHPSCSDLADGRIEVIAQGGTPPYTYQWANGRQSAVAEGLAVGQYAITVTDNRGCSVSAVFYLQASSCNRPPVAINDTVPGNSGEGRDIFVLLNDYDPDGDNIRITGIVNQPEHGNVIVNSDGTVTYVPDDGFVGTDMFTYVICDDGEPMLCDTANVYITIDAADPRLFIPNAISPNQDESNEFWEIQGLEKYPDNEVIIFNRWGNEVYRKKGYRNQWNGVNQDGEPLPDGTYYFILKLNDAWKSIFTGYVVIFRG
ncbi:MAG: hypothetical protein KatS3mg031_0671 [Chitinophagales bacterium]|nr:MAG: hypothetical protein KatS3mg031_0671 [Chitinophagales bacterium]